MAEVEILPDWAARYVQEQIAQHMHVINVLPIDKGAHSGAYLLNTSKGAVLIQKGRMSEVTHWFMPLPGERVTFGCQKCGEVMELVDPEVPRVIYCSRCGKQHYLVVRDGKLQVVGEEAPTEESGGYVLEGYTLYRGAGEGQYFFAKDRPASAEPAQLPPGHEVRTNPRTGIPVLVQPQEEPPYFAYRGDVHDVMDVEGIGEKISKRLNELGIRTTARLLYEDPDSLAARLDVPVKRVRSWQAMAELMLVKGIGRQHAEALARSGVAGIQELRNADPEQLAPQLDTFLEGLDGNVVGQPVTAKRVAAWQKAAAGMRRVRSKVPEE